ncbi:MAG: hypothetical protein P8J18_00245 [Halieaceae bacterium]|nr:hypothetical protein [Halieaceae bacterium]
MSLWDPILDRYRVNTDPGYLERRIELCLIFFLCLLFLQLSVGAFQIFSDSPPEPTPPLSEILNMASEVDFADMPPELLRELIERPLFWEGRKRGDNDLKPKPKVVERKQNLKPKVVKRKKPEQAKKMSQSVSVVGIFGGGDMGGAILKVQGKEIRLLIGESILDGWELSEVDEEKVVFTYGSYQDDRRLREASSLACKMDPSVCPQKQAVYTTKFTVGGGFN